MSWFGVTAGIGSIAGQVLGGLLLDADVFGLGWRIIFLINVPVGVGALVFALRLLPHHRSQRRPRLDPLGAVGISGSLALVLVPLILGREEGWPAWTLDLHGGGPAAPGRDAGLGAAPDPARRRAAAGPEPVPQPLLRRRAAGERGVHGLLRELHVRADAAPAGRPGTVAAGGGSDVHAAGRAVLGDLDPGPLPRRPVRPAGDDRGSLDLRAGPDDPDRGTAGAGRRHHAGVAADPDVARRPGQRAGPADAHRRRPGGNPAGARRGGGGRADDGPAVRERGGRRGAGGGVLQRARGAPVARRLRGRDGSGHVPVPGPRPDRGGPDLATPPPGRDPATGHGTRTLVEAA